jgi:hypothetical protein
MGVLYDGSVVICCGDYDGNISLGNVTTHSLISILNSPKAKLIEESFERYRVYHPYCQRCMGSTSRIKTLVKGLATIFLFKSKKFNPVKLTEIRL